MQPIISLIRDTCFFQKSNNVTLHFQLTLSIQNLPTLTQGDYECAFSGFNIVRTTVALIENQRNDTTFLRCETPYPNLLPPIPTGKGELLIWMSNAYRMLRSAFLSSVIRVVDFLHKGGNEEVPIHGGMWELRWFSFKNMWFMMCSFL